MFLRHAFSLDLRRSAKSIALVLMLSGLSFCKVKGEGSEAQSSEISKQAIPGTSLASPRASGGPRASTSGTSSSAAPDLSAFTGVRAANALVSRYLSKCAQDKNLCYLTKNLGLSPEEDLFGGVSMSRNGQIATFIAYGVGVAQSSDNRRETPQDNNDSADVLRLDLKSGILKLITSSYASRANSALALQTADRGSDQAWTSPNGRYTVFVSDATNLIAGGTSEYGARQVYRYDDVSGEIVLFSDPRTFPFPDEANQYESPSVSDEGRVAYVRTQNPISLSRSVIVAELRDAKIQRSVVNVQSHDPVLWSQFGAQLSGNGKVLLFLERNLAVVESHYQAKEQLYRVELGASLGATVSVSPSQMISVSANQQPANSSIRDHYPNYDGSRISFVSYADNLAGGRFQYTKLFIYDKWRDAQPSSNGIALVGESFGEMGAIRLDPSGQFFIKSRVNSMDEVFHELCQLTEPFNGTCRYYARVGLGGAMLSSGGIQLSDLSLGSSGAVNGNILFESAEYNFDPTQYGGSRLGLWSFFFNLPQGVLAP